MKIIFFRQNVLRWSMMNELMYMLESSVETIERRIKDNEPVYKDAEQEKAYKFGLKCAYDILKSRLEDLTDIDFSDIMKM